MTRYRILSLLMGLLLTVTLFTACSSGECSHSFTKWKEKEEATCTEDGKKVRECKKCGFEETKKILSLGHTEKKDSAKPATCKESGLTEGSHCSDCGEVLKKQEEIPVLEHVYQESVVAEATCQTGGTKKFTCSVCNESYTEPYSLTEFTADQVYAMAEASVGEIHTYDKYGNALALGTGFVYSNDGKIITNFHVIQDAYSAKITIGGRTYTVSKVLAYDKDIDVAVLKVDTTTLKTLNFCKNEHAVGKQVYALGSSKGLTATFSQGIITSNRTLDGVAYVQHDAAISSGNSGGPLLNSYGEVIGINTWTVRDSQNLNFAIRVTELDNLSYAEPLTFAQFYEKEFDVFTKMRDFVMARGTYDSQDQEYALYLDTRSSSGHTHVRAVYYDVQSDEIILYYIFDNKYLTSVRIDEIDGIYDWLFYTDSGLYVLGAVDAGTFTGDVLLPYTDHNMTYTNQLSEARGMATEMVTILAMMIETDYAAIGITAADLGFVYF